jgi:signal peptidase II
MIKRAQLSNLIWLLLSAAVIVVDQYTKHLAFTRLVFAEPYAITSFFNLTLLYNTGAAFSFMHGSTGWHQGLFSIIAVVISIALLIWLYRLPKHQMRMCMALSLILGGALGNLIDRIRLGFVIDFVDLHLGEYHFAVFNVADMAITFGALLIIIDAFITYHHGRGAEHAPQE